jgi:3-hydroxyacyl-CoA dehydrogenase
MTHPAGSQQPVEIQNVAVIGAGLAGRGFALFRIAAGFHVVLEDGMSCKSSPG